MNGISRYKFSKMSCSSLIAAAEAFKEFTKAVKRAEQAFLKSIEPDYIDLPEIMQEAQQGIGGDYEQCKLN